MREIKYFALFIICLFFIYSCNNSKDKTNTKVKYFLLSYNHSKTGKVDTIQILHPDSITKDMIPVDTTDFKYKNIRIIKFTRKLDLGADWSFVAFWEKHVGAFYMRSTIDGRIFRLKSSCDSINDYISTLTSFALARPELFSIPNLPPNDIVDK